MAAAGALAEAETPVTGTIFGSNVPESDGGTTEVVSINTDFKTELPPAMYWQADAEDEFPSFVAANRFCRVSVWTEKGVECSANAQPYMLFWGFYGNEAALKDDIARVNKLAGDHAIVRLPTWRLLQLHREFPEQSAEDMLETLGNARRYHEAILKHGQSLREANERGDKEAVQALHKLGDRLSLPNVPLYLERAQHMIYGARGSAYPVDAAVSNVLDAAEAVENIVPEAAVAAAGAAESKTTEAEAEAESETEEQPAAPCQETVQDEHLFAHAEEGSHVLLAIAPDVAAVRRKYAKLRKYMQWFHREMIQTRQETLHARFLAAGLPVPEHAAKLDPLRCLSRSVAELLGERWLASNPCPEEALQDVLSKTQWPVFEEAHFTKHAPWIRKLERRLEMEVWKAAGYEQAPLATDLLASQLRKRPVPTMASLGPEEPVVMVLGEAATAEEAASLMTDLANHPTYKPWLAYFKILNVKRGVPVPLYYGKDSKVPLRLPDRAAQTKLEQLHAGCKGGIGLNLHSLSQQVQQVQRTGNAQYD